MQSENGKPKRRKRGMIRAFCGAAAAAVLLAAVLLGACARGTKTVGTNVKNEDITDFYYTLSASTNPATYQRYRFTAADGAYTFYHETREGSRWPLTEEDITASGTVTLTPEQWGEFLKCIGGGTVRDRQENVTDGGAGPWLYLYWKGDRGKTQEFSFAGYGNEAAFLRLCEALKGNG